MPSSSNSTALPRKNSTTFRTPQDVFGPDFPGETFRVLKKKEIRQFSEYKTKRLVLEVWKKHNQYGKGEIICTLLK